MPSNPSLITNVGNFVLPDKKMPKLKGMEGLSWRDKDRTFDQIRKVLKQRATNWEIYSEHIIPEYTPISDQGRAGSCVGNGWCDAMEMLIGLQHGEKNVVQLSRRFLYWIARHLHQATDVDEGTFLRAAAHQLRKIGCVPEEDMPYDDRPSAIIGKDASPKLEHYTAASNNRLEGFYRLASEGEQLMKEIELAIRSNHPVVFGVPVTPEFQRYRGGSVFSRPLETEVIGNHCMIVVGVRFSGENREWVVRNSWSKYWGDAGHCRMTDDYLSLSEDTWVGSTAQRLI